MKKNLLFFGWMLLFTSIANAQVPQGIPYQAVARNGQGQPLASTNVKVRFSILDSIATGTAVYVESHSTNTTALGLFIANVGMGTASIGTFSSINWGQNYKFLKVELDTTATGNSYIDLGTQQMMSVPYALYAGNSINGIPTGGTQGRTITYCDGVPIWTTGGLCPARVVSLDCSSVINNGTLGKGTIASGVTTLISYTGGNGGVYTGQTVTSTGVTGLTATLSAGTLVTGSGSISFTISGTPASDGTAYFAISLGSQSCTFSRTVVIKAGVINSFACGNAIDSGNLIEGTAAIGVSSSIIYTGGNGGVYSAQTVNSTGVTGLIANIVAGNFNTGSGNLIYNITGTPNSGGVASFAIIIGGQSCTLSRNVDCPTSCNSTATCGALSVLNPASTYGSLSDQDGNVYKTIVIGTQEWMAENLKASHYRNGDLIPLVTSSAVWSGLTTGAVCWCNNDSVAYDCPYGKLYNWYALEDSRKVCPSGWHVSTDSEWITLQNYLGGNSLAGSKMKSNAPLVGFSMLADNSSGWSGLPGGARNTTGAGEAPGNTGWYWLSTDYDTNHACSYPLIKNNYTIVRNCNMYKNVGMSVRCVRD